MPSPPKNNKLYAKGQGVTQDYTQATHWFRKAAAQGDPDAQRTTHPTCYPSPMTYVITPPALPSLPILGSEQRFPVRRIFCIGRNYAAHAREMGMSVDQEAPMFFCKPADAIVADGADVPYPPATHDFHHEVELVVALAAGGRDIPVGRAAAFIWGYGVGLDLTRRDLQTQARDKGNPWDTSKAFDHSAPVSALRPAGQTTLDGNTTLNLTVNGQLRQQGRIGDMIHGVSDIIATLSTLFELQAGDLIFTGTPAGVGPLKRGDHFHAEVTGIASLDGRII